MTTNNKNNGSVVEMFLDEIFKLIDILISSIILTVKQWHI